MTLREHLIAQREHLRDGIEGHRKRLATMWENGQRSGWLFDKLNEQKELMEEKYLKVCNELCPMTGREKRIYRSVMKTFPATDPDSAYDAAIQGGIKFQFYPT